MIRGSFTVGEETYPSKHQAACAQSARKELLKDQTKSYLSALASHDVGKAEAELKKTVSRLDKVASKHTIHKNTASRRRSRLTLRLNALKAAGSGKGAKATA